MGYREVGTNPTNPQVIIVLSFSKLLLYLFS